MTFVKDNIKEYIQGREYYNEVVLPPFLVGKRDECNSGHNKENWGFIVKGRGCRVQVRRGVADGKLLRGRVILCSKRVFPESRPG